jgi:hypothetical protein
METLVISLSWEITQCTKALGDQENYELIYDIPVLTNGSKLNHSKFNSDYRVQVGLWLYEYLLYLKKYIDPDSTELLLGFYIFSKVHKTLVAGRPICNVYSLITSLAFTLVLKLLIMIPSSFTTLS